MINRRSKLLVTLGLAAACLVAATTPAGAAAPGQAASSQSDGQRLEQAVIKLVREQTGTASGRVEVQRRDGTWAFGVAVQPAPAAEGASPQGWIFLGHKAGSDWTVALDTAGGFVDLALQAPETVFSKPEKETFAARDDFSIQAGNNTELTLPWAVGQSWWWTGGAHGWGGSERPWSSMDFAGGDQVVRAAGSGTVYTMCADSSNGGTPGGWRRVYHPNGYTTDYYHMWYLSSLSNGQSIGAGQSLGQTGVNLCAGGGASGRHVHWGLMTGTTRVAWQWREAGKWVFFEGGSPYQGYALHGSARVNVGGQLYNYGALGANQGIIDAYDSGSVNKRSGPGTNYSIVGSVADGATVTISCWRNGTTHTGRYGTTSVWDKLTDGTWVSDAFVYTGVNTIGPNC